MAAVSQALAEACSLLRQDLYGYLDAAEDLALTYEEWSEEEAERARELIPDLVTVIREMLLQHKENRSCTCQSCEVAWPCPIVTTIHGLVKDPTNCFLALHDGYMNRGK